MKTQHTPGPWVWNTDRTELVGSQGEKVLQDGEGVWDLCSHASQVAGEPQRASANARLIAAAPDLLEANKELAAIVRELCLSYGHPLPEASLARSDAAIAKATGESE